MCLLRQGGFAYKSGQWVFRGVQLEVRRGEILAVLGPNGAGKTTLLKCVMGMLPLLEGECLLQGKPLAHYAPAQKWRQIAYVPQAKESAYALPAREMVVLGRSAHIGTYRLPGKKDYQKADEALERLGIDHLRQKSCDRMSGGELQMVLIARALVAEPALVILDEPESNLDFKNQMVVLRTLQNLAQQGVACMFNTHYPAHALRIAHRSLLLGREGSASFGDSVAIVDADHIGSAFGVRARIARTVVDGREYASVICVDGCDRADMHC